MPFTDQMLAGINLMALGMGIVFSFLIVLVFALKAMSELARLIGDTETDFPAQPTAGVTPAVPNDADGELVAVITAAINSFRSDRRP